jgi:hypothetical protein
MTLPLHVYRTGFLQIRFGYGSAQAVIEIVVVAIIAILVWAVITGMNLRLRFVRGEGKSPQSPALSIISLPLIIMLGWPVVGLMLWGLWLVLGNGGFAPASEVQDWGQLFGNSLTRPLLTIWFIQLPLAYLVALTLGFFRPLGRIGSSIVFLPFLLFALLPTSALKFAWFEIAREQGIVGLDSQYFPWRFGGLSLIALKMFFDGAHDAHREATSTGKSPGEVFINHVLLPSLPVMVIVGVALSILAAGEFLWAFVSLTDPDSMTATINFVSYLRAGSTNPAVVTGSAVYYAGIIGVIFLPIVAVLHIFVLDRLALVAGDLRAADDPVTTLPVDETATEETQDTESGN